MLNLPYGYLGDKHIKVVYRGPYWGSENELRPGHVYEVFSHSKGGDGAGFWRDGLRADTLSVRFSDPDDSCGGVLTYFASDFEFVEDWSI